MANGVTEVIDELEVADRPPLAYRIASYWLPSWPDRRPTCCSATATARQPSGPLISKEQMPTPNTVRAEGTAANAGGVQQPALAGSGSAERGTRPIADYADPGFELR